MYLCLQLFCFFVVVVVRIVIYFIKVCYKHKYHEKQSIILGTNMIMSITKIGTPMVQYRRFIYEIQLKRYLILYFDTSLYCIAALLFHFEFKSMSFI